MTTTAKVTLLLLFLPELARKYVVASLRRGALPTMPVANGEHSVVATAGCRDGVPSAV